MEQYCPICGRNLIVSEERLNYIDYACSIAQASNEHFYVHRLDNNQITKIKFRIDNLLMKINFDEGFSAVWTAGASRNSEIVFQDAEMPDFSNLNKIKRKIKMLLTFS